MQVRKARKEDLNYLIMMAESFHSEFKQDGDPNFSVYQAALHFSSAMNNDDMCCFVVFLDDKLIGFITARINKVPCSEAVETHNDYLYVLPDFRKQGAAQLLIFMFTDWSKKRAKQKEKMLWKVNLGFRFTLGDRAIAAVFKDTEFEKSGIIYSMRL